MNIESPHISVGGLNVEVVRKKIKNLHLAVYPPAGRVRVAVPLHISDEAVRLAVITRLSWIKKQQEKFEGQERQTEREYVSGETHYFLGRPYRLNVTYQPGRSRVSIRNKSVIDLFVPDGADLSHRKRIFTEWYRGELKELVPPLIQKWEPIIGMKVAEWGVKKMKTKWGTCMIKARRIWLNLELIKKSPRCLEYVVVHEMVHFLERLHNDRFKGFMDTFLPQWKLYRDELNRSPLGHEEWGC